MIDLMAEGYRLWGVEPEKENPTPAEIAEVAEKAQPRVLPPAEVLRMNCGNPQPVANPQPIRSESAPHNPRGHGKSAESARSAAPAHEIERIIDVLEVKVGRELGPDLKDLMRRAMAPLDRRARATLAAEIDGTFEHAASIRQAREQAGRAIRGKVGDPPPTSVADWLGWIEGRCPINADDRRYIAYHIQHLPLTRMATTCRWYAQTWAKAAAEESSNYRKENAGRCAANAALLAWRTAQ